MRWKRSLSVQEERAKIQVLRGTFQVLHEAPWPMRGSSSLTGHGLFIPHAMSLPWGCRVLNKFIKILSFEWVGEKVASLIVYIQLSQVRSSLYIYLSLTSCWNSWLWFSPLESFLTDLKRTKETSDSHTFYSPWFWFRHLCSRYKINFLLLLHIWRAYDG